MNLDDIKERLKSDWQRTSEKLQDNPLIIQIKEKYQNLAPRAQKLTLIGTSVLVIVTAVSFPMGYYEQSNANLEEFKTGRDLLRDLFKAHREINHAPKLSAPVDFNRVQSEIENKSTVMKLLPEQIKGSNSYSGADKSQITKLIPDELVASGMTFQFSKLNLRQIVEMGYVLLKNNPNLKMTGIDIKESEPEKSNMKGYFDVVYKVAALNIPEEPKSVPPPAAPSKAGRIRSNDTSNSNDKDNSKGDSNDTPKDEL